MKRVRKKGLTGYDVVVEYNYKVDGSSVDIVDSGQCNSQSQQSSPGDS